MKIYLVQHAEAVPKEENPERPLSRQGSADARRIGDFAAAAGVRISRVLHSGKLRAEQTAELLAAALGVEKMVQRIDGIKPKDSVEDFADTLETAGDTLIVGHLPFMARLVSFLTTGDAEAMQVAFRPGSIVCLEREVEGPWSFNWMIRPELLQDSGG